MIKWVTGYENFGELPYTRALSVPAHPPGRAVCRTEGGEETAQPRTPKATSPPLRGASVVFACRGFFFLAVEVLQHETRPQGQEYLLTIEIRSATSR